MLDRAMRSAWTCSRCLRHQLQRRGNSTAATSIAALAAPEAVSGIINYGSPEASSDDKVLRKIFDSAGFWKEFSRQSQVKYVLKPKGLFQNQYLTRPEGFQQFAQVTIQKCERILQKVVAARETDEYRRLVRDLDRLSDLLCRVIDLSDFVRSTHPDGHIQAAATQAYALMYEYMNRLNTMTSLNDQLKRASSIPEIWDSWSEEEQVVAKILMRDFSKSAIDLPAQARQKFVDLSNDIANTGTEFVDKLGPATPYLSFDSKKMKGLDPGLAKSLSRWGNINLPTIGMPPVMALRHVQDPEVRQEIYMANRTASPASIRRLERLMKKRAELAELSGYPTFAHMALSDKMAKTPEAVDKFLSALAADNQSLAQSEQAQLLELKKSDAHPENFPNVLNAWDRDYYTARLVSTISTKIRSAEFLSVYFSLGTVMQGLSRLFSRLYGVRLVPREASPGETWNDDVRRLDVIDEADGHIAVVYCDLFSRPGKNPNPAHFTLRCSREIPAEEVAEAATTPHPFDSATLAATDGMAASLDPSTNTLHQLPTIALICDFARPPPSSSPRPTLLTFREVQTLFHEMGHALHSVLGRTALQNVAGTRCATDFAELPSVLMEHFAADPSVLALYARHWETDAPLPRDALEQRLRLDRRMTGAETEAQILLARLDQACHALVPGTGGGGGLAATDFDSTRVYHAVCAAHGTLPEPAGTAWQGFFGHLFGYGATYYSYLFDRAIAGRLWKRVFRAGKAGGALDREAGERMKREVLRWGGARDGWACVAGVLGDERLKGGGEWAMGEVGRWGVKE